MKNPTSLMASLHLKIPLILAPMGGGPGTPELAAAVCEAGGLGSVAGAYLSAEDLTREIQETRRLTSQAFAVNLFAPSSLPPFSDSAFRRAVESTEHYRKELSLPVPQLPLPTFEDFDNQMEVILREKPAAFSFVFGCLEQRYMRKLKDRRILTMGTATSLEEAMALEASGVDAVIAQGFEAGGHRGMFLPEDPDPAVDLLPLARSLTKVLKIPVIAAGGIMDGIGIADALAAGAQAAQLGTAFLLCPESGINPTYRKALRQNRNHPTELTRAFSGRWARGVANRFMQEIGARGDNILDWPYQNFFTRDIRKQAAKAGKAEFLSLWAGSGLPAVRELPAYELVSLLKEELRLAQL